MRWWVASLPCADGEATDRHAGDHDRTLTDGAPGALPLLVLPVHDDQAALYRSVGTGMNRRPPRYPILHLVAQTQGIVGVVTAVVAASFVGLALAGWSTQVAWVVAAVVFVATVVTLFVYWQRSMAEIQAGIVPLYPTPQGDIGAPF